MNSARTPPKGGNPQKLLDFGQAASPSSNRTMAAGAEGPTPRPELEPDSCDKGGDKGGILVFEGSPREVAIGRRCGAWRFGRSPGFNDKSPD